MVDCVCMAGMLFELLGKGLDGEGQGSLVGSSQSRDPPSGIRIGLSLPSEFLCSLLKGGHVGLIRQLRDELPRPVLGVELRGETEIDLDEDDDYYPSYDYYNQRRFAAAVGSIRVMRERLGWAGVPLRLVNMDFSAFSGHWVTRRDRELLDQVAADVVELRIVHPRAEVLPGDDVPAALGRFTELRILQVWVRNRPPFDLEGMAIAVGRMTQLVEVDLSGTTLFETGGEDSCRSLGQALGALPALRRLGLSECRGLLSESSDEVDGTFRQLAFGLRASASLRLVDLSGCFEAPAGFAGRDRCRAHELMEFVAALSSSSGEASKQRERPARIKVVAAG